MQTKQLLQRALEIRAKYAELEKKKDGKEWNNLDLANGFARDVKDLLKLVTAKEKGLETAKLDKALAHELADCLWSVLVISDKYGVDIEQSFMKSMDQLEKRIEKETEKL